MVPTRPSSLILNQTALESSSSACIVEVFLLLKNEASVGRGYVRRPRHVVVASRIGTFSHICDQRPDVALWPERPVQCDFGPGGCVGMQRCRLRANDATFGVSAALKISDRHVLNWSVALDHARDSIGLGVKVRLRMKGAWGRGQLTMGLLYGSW